MEFRFAVNEIFHQPIVEIGHSLIPAGFKGDRRQFWDTINKVADVIDALGSASANAQGLTRPITTSDRLRNSEQQILYLMIDASGNQGKGAVTGMLKTGRKALYVFDRDGHHYQVQAPCILDFYVHETRQRSGYGKKLFEYMLQREEVEPKRLAIDRPSDKFLAFLCKHYALSSPIRQMNNFVVYDGFFPKSDNSKEQVKQNGGSPHKGSNGLQAQILTSPYGRYGAPRPPCSMGQIIHNQSSTVTGSEQTGEANLNSFPNYHENNNFPPQGGYQGQHIDNSKRHPMQPRTTTDQPLQQNEVSATFDDDPISTSNHPANQQKDAKNANPLQGGNSAFSNVANSNNLIKIVKMAAVGNGMSNESDEVRLEKLARVNSAPTHSGDGVAKPECYWPFAVPTQDYVYEKRFHHAPIPTLGTGMHKLLQPDQYVIKKQIAPAKDEIDKLGRPKSSMAVNAPQSGHYYPYGSFSHATQPAPCQAHHPHTHAQSQGSLQKQLQAIQAHPPQHHHHQPQQPQPQPGAYTRNLYDNNVTSYNYYAPKPGHNQNQYYYDLQQMYNDQQMYQQQLEQQYAYDQMQQQLWEGYQNWLHYSAMQQYPQYATMPYPQYSAAQYPPYATMPTCQHSHTHNVPAQMQQPQVHQQMPGQYQQPVHQQMATPKVGLPQQKIQQVHSQGHVPHQHVQQQQQQQQQPHQQQQKDHQLEVVKPDVQPEKLIAAEPMEQALRSYYQQPKPTHVNVPPHPDKDKVEVRPQHSPTMYERPQYHPNMVPNYYPNYQQYPQAQMSQQQIQQQQQLQQQQSQHQQSPQVYATQSTPKVCQSIHDVSKTNVQREQKAPSPPQSTHNIHSVRSHPMIQQPLLQTQHSVLGPLTPEQIAVLTPQQQLMYYQEMLTQPSSYHQNSHGMYNPYNPVFGLPSQHQQHYRPQSQPQTQMQQMPPPMQNLSQSQLQGLAQQQAHQQAQQQHEIEVKDRTSTHSLKMDNKAAGDAPHKSAVKLAVPYPFPIITKSSLEPLQPSVPLRRHMKPPADDGNGNPNGVPEQQPSSTRKVSSRMSSVTVKPTARIASAILKSTINMASTARSNYDMSICPPSKTPRLLNLYTPSKTVRRMSNEKQTAKVPMPRSPSPKDSKDLVKRSNIITEFIEQLPS